MDPSLLETEYDVLLVGTGMVESILAGALARVGKKVLHLDQNDHYGSNFASFQLRQFIAWAKNERVEPRRYDEEYSHDHQKPVTDAPETEDADAVREEWPIKDSFRCYLVEQGFADEDVEQELLKKSSSFSIDINPRLVLSSEELVQMLITSGVGRYLEFVGMERTYMHFEQATATEATNATLGDTVWEVPCSKKDVFQSKLLGMVEKRMLMKFLQFVADYGETHILGEDVKTKNERDLALGRSLKRPQNKSNQTGQLEDSALTPYLSEPFQVLLEKHFKLSPKLQQVVLYCVGLASFPASKNQMTGAEGLAAVYRYVASIGRFTGNAFLVPSYGVSEITQSFCRLSAVYGGIYVLRAPITHFVVDPTSKHVAGIKCSDGRVLRGKTVITNVSYADCLTRRKLVKPQVLRGVFVLKTQLRHNMNRIMCVIPPEDATLKNSFAVQVVQLDWSASVCPRDCYLVQVTTPIPHEWQGNAEKQKKLMMNVMERLIRSAIAEQAAKSPSTAPAEEAATAASEATSTPDWTDSILWHAIFATDSNTTTKSTVLTQDHLDLPSNVHVCEAASRAHPDSDVVPVAPLEIHLESASHNARAIFDQLCPDEEFLPKSAGAEQAEKEEQEESENAVLKAAQKLVSETEDTIVEAVNDPPVDGSAAATSTPANVEDSTHLLLQLCD